MTLDGQVLNIKEEDKYSICRYCRYPKILNWITYCIKDKYYFVMSFNAVPGFQKDALYGILLLPCGRSEYWQGILIKQGTDPSISPSLFYQSKCILIARKMLKSPNNHHSLYEIHIQRKAVYVWNTELLYFLNRVTLWWAAILDNRNCLFIFIERIFWYNFPARPEVWSCYEKQEFHFEPKWILAWPVFTKQWICVAYHYCLMEVFEALVTYLCKASGWDRCLSLLATLASLAPVPN